LKRDSVMQRVYVAIMVLLLVVVSAIAAGEEPLVELHVYSDGSVSLSYYNSTTVTTPGYQGNILLRAVLDVGRGNYGVNVEVYGETGYSCMSRSNCTYLEVSVNATSSSDGGVYNTSGWASVRVWDDKGNTLSVIVDPLTSTLNTTTLVGSVTGTVHVNASGDFSSILAFLPLLNRQTLEMVLKQANITWVTIEKFTVTSGDGVHFDFELGINYSEFLGSIGVDTERYKQCTSIWGNGALSLYIYSNTTDVKIAVSASQSGDINKHGLCTLELMYTSWKSSMNRAQHASTRRILPSSSHEPG